MESPPAKRSIRVRLVTDVMQKTAIALLICTAGLRAQTCTILDPLNCGTTGVYAGPPTLESFVAGLSTAFPTALANAAGLPQPRVIYSREIVPASQSFMIYDPRTCPASGTCLYNNPTVIDNWIDSLVDAPPNGVGLTSVDLNLWVGPLFQSSQYLASGLNYCGTYGACYSFGANATWYSNGLSTYDQVFAHLANKAGIKIRIAPMISGDVLIACGIQQNSFTELQVEQCLVPLLAAMVKRWHVDDDTVIHEPCGVLAEVLGTTPNCAMSVSDLDTFIQHAAAAVRVTSQNSAIRIGAGALNSDATGTCPGSLNFWCDWYTNLMPAGVLDFGGIDLYPNVAVPVANYNDTLASYAAMAAHVVAIGRPVTMNEASGMRWENPAGAGGEANTYWGCGASEWYTDGTMQAWSRAIPGVWAAANGISIVSVFPTEDLMLLSTDTASNHCATGDGFEANLSAALADGPLVSFAGQEYAVLAAGWNTSLQGHARLTGRGNLGH
jgi:hypothetical protein